MGWVEMEKYFPGRTDEACKKRYKKLEHKTDRRWTNFERDKLIELVKIHGEDWETLSEKLPTSNIKYLLRKNPYSNQNLLFQNSAKKRLDC